MNQLKKEAKKLMSSNIGKGTKIWDYTNIYGDVKYKNFDGQALNY